MRWRGFIPTLRIPRFSLRHVEREVDDEIAFHLAQRQAQLGALGMPPETAHAEALRRFGDLPALRGECVALDRSDLRREHVRTFVEQLFGDFRFAARSLARAPGFSIVALVTLVVGIAAVAAIFSFVYSAYYRPLPYKDADRILAFDQIARDRPVGLRTVSWEVGRTLRADSRSFERVTLFDDEVTRLISGDEPLQVVELFTDTSFAPLFGLRPELGRLIAPEDVQQQAPVAVISDELWRSAFGGDSTIVGRPAQFGDDRLTIVGVMPARFRFPARTDLWRPLAEPSGDTAAALRIGVLAKLRPGATRDRVRADLGVLARQIAAQDTAKYRGFRLVVEDEMIDRRAGSLVPLPSVFIGAALFVLLIACSNVTNLLLVRAAERRGEMAVRRSLGASSLRIIRQSVAESLLLSAVAGLLGALFAKLLVKVGLAFLPTANFPSWLRFGLDGRVLVFVIAVVLIVTIAVGFAPARESARFDLVRSLKLGSGTSSRGSVARAGRRALAVQLALSIALFVGAGLMARTYTRLSALDVGYPAQDIVTLTAYFDREGANEQANHLRVLDDIAARIARASPSRTIALRAAPTYELQSATAPSSARTPGRAAVPDYRLIPDGDTLRALSFRNWPPARSNAVSEDYFATLGLRILRGRGVSNADNAGSQPVVVVSRRMAQTFWPHVNPIGRTLQQGLSGLKFTVVGVVEDVRDIQGGRGGMIAEPRQDVYLSIRQVGAFQFGLLVRASGAVASVQNVVKRAARAADPRLVVGIDTMDQPIRATQFVTEVFGAVIGAFAIAGLLLSVIGVYGVIAYGIAQRTKEIGIRIALGGTTSRVVAFIMRESMRFVGAGVVAGIVLSLFTNRALKIFIFGISTADPLTYLAASVALASVSVIACYLPARRAGRVDPVIALRAE
jgi:putative ABC transport system permease protein